MTPIRAQSEEIKKVIVGNRVRVARELRGWTLREAEAATGINDATWCRIEAGKVPSLETAIRVAKALGFAVEELWKVSDESDVSQPA